MPDVSPDAPSERILGGRYRLLKELASGGMGTVWRAEHLGLKKPIALKLLNADYASNSKAFARLEREAVVLAKLEHPHAVRVYDFGKDEGQPYLAMEFVEGITLESLLDKGLPPLELVVKIVGQILEVLEVAHASGILHRDLKPANVMLQGEAHDFVKVVDFGIAMLNERENAPALTDVGNIVGTPQYMSPEQIRGEPLDGRSDLYSLGCLAFESLTNRHVFTSRSSADIFAAHMYREPDRLSEVVPERHFPSGLQAVITKLLQKEPASRYGSASEARAAVLECLTKSDGRETRNDRPAATRAPENALFTGAPVAVTLVHDGSIAAEYDLLQNALAVAGATPVPAENAEVLVVLAAAAPKALETARELIKKYPRVPVLVCSTDDNVERFAEAIALGVHDYISLPMEPSKAVKRVLSAKRKGGKR